MLYSSVRVMFGSSGFILDAVGAFLATVSEVRRACHGGPPYSTVWELGPDPGDALLRLRSVVRRHVPIRYGRLLHRKSYEGMRLEWGHLGLCNGDHILLDSGMAPALEFWILSHEFAHWRLGHSAGSQAYWQDECEATAVAALLARAVGIEPVASVAAGYLLQWRGDRFDFIRSTDRILLVAMYVWSELGPRPLPPGAVTVASGTSGQAE